MKNPDIFIVGFQRCGSSSLAHLLDQHPRIVLSKPKETYHLVDKDSNNYNYEQSVNNPNINWSQFYPDKSEDKLWLEASVCNFYQEKALNYISQLKTSKVIFILRDPVDRLWSTYQYYGKKDLKLKANLTFNEYLEYINDGVSIKEGVRLALDHGFYSKYIDNWIKKIGKERILIVGMKSLIQDTFVHASHIYNFLEIETPELISLPHKNFSKEKRWPVLSSLIYRIIGGNNLGQTLVGQWYRKLNAKKNEQGPPDKIREDFKLFYKDEYNRFTYYF